MNISDCVINKYDYSRKVSKSFSTFNMQNPPIQEAKEYNAIKLTSDSYNKYLINFKGLNNVLGKQPYQSVKTLKRVAAECPNSMGIVGNLPREWVEKISGGKSKIKEFYLEFKKIINDYRADYDVKQMSSKLQTLMSNLGIVSPIDQLDVQYLERGRFGTGFHIKGTLGNKYVLKIFHNTESTNNIHGNHIELNRALFWQRRAGDKNQKVRFYFGDIDSGYMINSFVRSDSPSFPSGKYVPEFIYGLKNVDVEAKALNGHNKRNGYEIDYGGLTIINNLTRNKAVSYIYKRFMKLPKEERTIESFNQIIAAKAKIKGQDVDLSLAYVMKLMPEKERINAYSKLLEICDNDIKLILTEGIHLIPDKRRAETFNKLLIGANNKVKIALADNLLFLPKESRLEPFKNLLKGADSEVLDDIAKTCSFSDKALKDALIDALDNNISSKKENKGLLSWLKTCF